MTPTAYMYTCRNLGQVALLWRGQPAPTGPGWIDVKQTALYTADQVEGLRKALQQIRDNSDDLTACEVAADALKDFQK